MNKKEIVIEKARELFKKYGYKKVSMDEISKEANVTKKTIYSYFKDKEELFKYFIQEELEMMRENIEQKEKENLTLIEIFSSNIYSMLKFKKNSSLFSKDTKDDLDEYFLKIYDKEILRYIEQKLQKEMEIGNIKKCNAHLTAFIIYKIYLSVMFEYDDEIEEESVTKEVTSILKDGLFN